MKPQPFAFHGSEKMIYDIRMGPQALYHEGCYYICYQANEKNGRALPHIIQRGIDGVWSPPVILGDVTGYNPHFAPVIWLDATLHIHVMYHAYMQHNKSIHTVSSRPLDISSWERAPIVAASISYPRILPLAEGRWGLYYRALGTMGYWTYQTSTDGGATWSGNAQPVVDFDQHPHFPGEEWAGSYHSVVASNDGRSLHVAFVYGDERNLVHPVFKKKLENRNRYNLYYMRIDCASGNLYNAAGDRLPRPLRKRDADAQCVVVNSGYALTNTPAILPDADDSPRFMLPVSGASLDTAAFHFITWNGIDWDMKHVQDMTNTWNGAQLEHAADGGITAYLVGKPGTLGNLTYGGGIIQEWHSADNGQSWRGCGSISIGEGMLCNNPRMVEDRYGKVVPRTLIFFGWSGPNSITAEDTFTGQAYLWQAGTFL